MTVHLDPEAWKKKVKRRRIILITLAALLVLGGVTLYLLRGRIVPAIHYSQAESALQRGETQEAIDIFAMIGSYRDANDRAAQIAFDAQTDSTLHERFRTAKLGDIVEFGRYEQDNSMSNGPEPIRWFVLAKENGRLLLWAEQVLDTQMYHETGAEITWEGCSLRAWLNADFKSTAFTEAEQLLIAKTALENKNNPASNTRGGSDTEDYVFIVSFDEIVQYGVNNPNLEGLYTTPTLYAKGRGVEQHGEYGTCVYWVRTPGIDQKQATFCDMVGMPLYTAAVNKKGYGVRPMLWVFAGDNAD